MRVDEDGGLMNGSRYLGVLLFYLLLTLVMTYPLLAHFEQGVLGLPLDSFEYLYKLWWFKSALFDRGIPPFFNPDVFYPEGYHLALHEMTLINICLGMPFTVLGGEVVSYNALILLSFVLSGFGVYLLAFRLTRQQLAALVGGVIYAFCSYRMAHLSMGHLNLLGSQWLPFLFLSLEQMLETKRLQAAILVGVFFALLVLSAWNYLPAAAIFAALYTLWRGRPWREHLLQCRLVFLFVASAIVAAAFMSPIIVLTLPHFAQGEMAFVLPEVDLYSASVEDFFMPNVMHPLWGRLVASHYVERENALEYFIGLSWVAIVLSVAALWTPRKQVSSAYVLLLGISFVLALGTTLHIDGQRIYLEVPAWIEKAFTVAMHLLAKRLAFYPQPRYYELRHPGAIYIPLPTLLCYLYLPFFKAMRVWARFGLISAFAVAVLACIGLARIMHGAKGDETCSGWRAWPGWLSLALVVFELAALPYPLGWTEVKSQPMDRWLAQQAEDGAVAQFPLERSERDPSRLYATAVHGRPFVHGYGSFFPRRYRQLRRILWDFPSVQAIDLLRDWDVRYVLVGANSYGAKWPDIRRRIGQFEELHLVATFDEEALFHSAWLSEAIRDCVYHLTIDCVYVYELR